MLADMWLLLLLLSGLGLASPRPSELGSADLVLVAGDGEMSDLMKTAITMMEDRADTVLELEQVSAEQVICLILSVYYSGC